MLGSAAGEKEACRQGVVSSMSFGSAPEPILRVTVGSPIFTRDDQKIGVVKEIRGRAFKVDAGFWREFWLGAESLAAAIPGQSVTLVTAKADLNQHKLKAPPAPV